MEHFKHVRLPEIKNMVTLTINLLVLKEKATCSAITEICGFIYSSFYDKLTFAIRLYISDSKQFLAEKS